MTFPFALFFVCMKPECDDWGAGRVRLSKSDKNIGAGRLAGG